MIELAFDHVSHKPINLLLEAFAPAETFQMFSQANHVLGVQCFVQLCEICDLRIKALDVFFEKLWPVEFV